ncbi:MAG: Ferrous iron transport protein B [Candidatus Anoxychlamydiales bacterium]|nr:Ferrous iron transport protein B [Candidatus Anoxychlamydiales bacterium]
MRDKNIKIALIGNPNTGKTTIFNHLTGFRQKIANYPGVTVEKKSGLKKLDDITLEIIDLPGIYSLSAHSEDEKVAKNFILDEKPDVIINIVDASNLEKSLFLTTQLLELGRPVLLGLNMIDIAKKRDLKIDTKFLENILEIEIATLIANKKKGIDTLIDKAISISLSKKSFGAKIKFDSNLEKEIKNVEKLFIDKIDLSAKRLFAIKLLEQDKHVQKKIDSCSIIKKVSQIKDILEKRYKEDLEIVFSIQRHDFIRSILTKIYQRKEKFKKNRSDKIDEILTHKIFGFPIFLLFMYLTFQFTFTLGAYPTAWIENIFTFITSTISNLWPQTILPLFRSLVIDGVVAGIGSVVVFMPNIVMLFFCISILEDSGYMARAAFILDRLMHKIGLHGKSFIPMLIGFGCSVPAIMATRFMESKKDRIITILAIPLVACSAKLTIFALLIPAFFPKAYQPIVLFSLYLVGLALAIVVIKIFKITLFKGKAFSFVMELPSYKVPSIFTTLIHMWDKTKEYLKKAGTVILGFSIIFWALSTFPIKSKDISESYMGKIGKAMTPIFKPLGFDWKVNTALIGSFAAKEVFISQIGVIYAVKDSDDTISLQNSLKNDYSALQAYCIMLFVLISAPCIATIAITRKETGSHKWAFFQLGYLTLLAYIVSLFAYQIGSIFI